jgi:hypothetical protein
MILNSSYKTELYANGFYNTMGSCELTPIMALVAADTRCSIVWFYENILKSLYGVYCWKNV